MFPLTPISRDNQGSIFIASNPITEKRSKHIDIRYHKIHEFIADGSVEIFFVDGEKNPADLLTKNLGVAKFNQFRSNYALEFSPTPFK